jgi:UDP-N-acetylglucosamine 4-epimerase
MRESPLHDELRARPRRWLVTGAAGFIGSHLVETLLELDQFVTGLDNFATGHQANLDEVRDRVSAARWQHLRFMKADVRDAGACLAACDGVDVVLHQAALGSVPRSIENPLQTHESNVTGFLNMLVGAKHHAVPRFVYASSSSVYGDHPASLRTERVLGAPLSPYAATKRANELYAQAFARTSGISFVGLRYFNVFGPRQDPSGAYAAVIPRWARALLRGEAVTINGDGLTTRDFCYVQNVVQANLLAATAGLDGRRDEVFNIGAGGTCTLLQLFEQMRSELATRHPVVARAVPIHARFRAGDVRHSTADIAKARRELGYAPSHSLQRGLQEAMPWYEAH